MPPHQQHPGQAIRLTGTPGSGYSQRNPSALCSAAGQLHTSSALASYRGCNGLPSAPPPVDCRLRSCPFTARDKRSADWAALQIILQPPRDAAQASRRSGEHGLLQQPRLLRQTHHQVHVLQRLPACALQQTRMKLTHNVERRRGRQLSAGWCCVECRGLIINTIGGVPCSASLVASCWCQADMAKLPIKLPITRPEAAEAAAGGSIQLSCRCST